jgi:hypothetical protein
MNKGEIRAHFIALLNRSDCSNALADTFIDQAITRIQRQLRVPAMEKQNTYNVTSASGVATLVMPSDLLEVIELYYDGNSLTRIPLHEMVQYQKTGELGSPRFFCREQGNLKIHPKPSSGDLYLNYYAEQDALTSDSDTNMLTNIASDLLTYTALSYAADYFLDERGAIFDQKSGSFLAEIQEHANSSEQSGVNQVVRPTHYYED